MAKAVVVAVVLWASAATQLVACAGDAANELSSERVGKSAAACLNTGGLQARFVDNDDELFADAVHVTTTGNKATVNLYDSSDAAKENYRITKDDVPESSRLALLDNSVVTWDKAPSSDDEDAVTECLSNAS
jgi:hypothetical protein